MSTIPTKVWLFICVSLPWLHKLVKGGFVPVKSDGTPKISKQRAWGREYVVVVSAVAAPRTQPQSADGKLRPVVVTRKKKNSLAFRRAIYLCMYDVCVYVYLHICSALDGKT